MNPLHMDIIHEVNGKVDAALPEYKLTEHFLAGKMCGYIFVLDVRLVFKRLEVCDA